MSARFLIIDGYNLMHAADLARAKYGPGDLARQRHLLLVKLRSLLSAEERKRCTVVFDAIDAPANLPGRFRYEEMTVLFAERGHQADELIEELIQKHSAPRRLTVVSSDHRIQTAVNRRRGTAIDSEIFLRLSSSKQEKLANPIPTSKDDPGELEFWLREFEGIQPAELDEDPSVDKSGPKSRWGHEIEELQKWLQDPEQLKQWLDGRDPH